MVIRAEQTPDAIAVVDEDDPTAASPLLTLRVSL